MHPSIAPVAQLYGVTTALFEKALTGLDREALLRRPGTETNPILWIAGHLASSRFGLASALGCQRDVPWGTLFFKGNAAGDLATLPEIGSIQGAWRDISQVLATRLDELTEAELSAPFPRSFPIPDGSSRGAITFLAFHEGYHVGQMALLRKWLGFPGLVDG